MDNVFKFILGIAVILVVWGIIGGIQTNSINYSCDMGLGNILCWKWHTNLFGELKHLADATAKQNAKPNDYYDFTYNFTYDNENKEFVFTWSDSSSLNTSYKLISKTYMSDEPCEYVSNAKTGTFKCPVNSDGYFGQAFRTVNGVEIRLDDVKYSTNYYR